MKCDVEKKRYSNQPSPSVWREWIEIQLGDKMSSYIAVSLRVEGVD